MLLAGNCQLGSFALAVHVMIVLLYYQMQAGSGSGAVVWPTWHGSFFWYFARRF